MASTMVGTGARRPYDARALDVAKGVLVGVRRCSPEAAFAEIVEVANRHRFPPIRLAQAIVDSFADPTRPTTDDPAFDIVQLCWGPLLYQPTTTLQPQ